MPRERFDATRLKRSGALEIIFPISCGRVEYVARSIVFSIVITVPAMGLIFLEEAYGWTWASVLLILLLLLQLVLVLLGCAIPRLRDLGWSPWMVLLSFIPGVNIFLSLALLFAPGKTIR